MMTLVCSKLINRVAQNQNFTINRCFKFAWKAYNKLNFDRNVKLSLANRKYRRLSHLKNNSNNNTENQNFTYFAIGFCVISPMIN